LKERQQDFSWNFAGKDIEIYPEISYNTKAVAEKLPAGMDLQY